MKAFWLEWVVVLSAFVCSIGLWVYTIGCEQKHERPAVTFDGGSDTGWFHEEDGGVAFAFNGQAMVLDPDDLVLSVRNSASDPLADVRELDDGGYELRLFDSSAVRVVLPDGGLCR